MSSGAGFRSTRSGIAGTRPGTARGARRRLSLADGGQGLATEYWIGQDRVFVCFCGACGWSGDIVLAARVVGHEAAD